LHLAGSEFFTIRVVVGVDEDKSIRDEMRHENGTSKQSFLSYSKLSFS